ncbi:MAG: hypothetical protein MUC87_08255 [Bacteroidia bacterium]|jgi:hypothetical protein|nr:hypothetical protein [Bacteroidia bacterium]
MKNLACLFLLILTFNACNTEPKVKTITIKNQYTLNIPEPFTPIANLNEEASLEYGNTADDFYVIVIDESKLSFREALELNGIEAEYKPDLQGYTDILINSLKQEMVDFKISELKDTVLNNLPAKLANITGKVNAYDVYFQYAFIEGRNNFYQVMTWANLNKKDRYLNAMNKMVRSLKEL